MDRWRLCSNRKRQISPQIYLRNKYVYRIGHFQPEAREDFFRLFCFSRIDARPNQYCCPFHGQIYAQKCSLVSIGLSGMPPEFSAYKNSSRIFVSRNWKLRKLCAVRADFEYRGLRGAVCGEAFYAMRSNFRDSKGSANSI